MIGQTIGEAIAGSMTGHSRANAGPTASAGGSSLEAALGPIPELDAMIARIKELGTWADGILNGDGSQAYSVSRGDTVEAIARATYGDNWLAGEAAIMASNPITRNRYGSPMIYPGDNLVLPSLNGQDIGALSSAGGALTTANAQGLEIFAAERAAAAAQARAEWRPIIGGSASGERQGVPYYLANGGSDIALSLTNAPYGQALTGPSPAYGSIPPLTSDARSERSTATPAALPLRANRPGLAESLIPVWGSARMAIADFEDGNYGLAAFNAAMAISDVFLVKAVATGIVRGGIRLSGHSWTSMRGWMRESGHIRPGEIGHHGIIPQRGWGTSVPNSIKNQPWNIRSLPEGIHVPIHQSTRQFGPRFGFVGRVWYGTPTWVPSATMSLGGRVANGANPTVPPAWEGDGD